MALAFPDILRALYGEQLRFFNGPARFDQAFPPVPRRSLRSRRVSTQLPSRRLPVECDFSPDGLFEARFRVENTSNLREGEQLPGLADSRRQAVCSPAPREEFANGKDQGEKRRQKSQKRRQAQERQE